MYQQLFHNHKCQHASQRPKFQGKLLYLKRIQTKRRQNHLEKQTIKEMSRRRESLRNLGCYWSYLRTLKATFNCRQPQILYYRWEIRGLTLRIWARLSSLIVRQRQDLHGQLHRWFDRLICRLVPSKACWRSVAHAKLLDQVHLQIGRGARQEVLWIVLWLEKVVVGIPVAWISRSW